MQPHRIIPVTVTTRTIAREPLLEGRIFAVERCSWLDSDGCERVREVVRHPGAVTIVPVLDDGRLVLVRNWRIAVGGPLWEFPAGKREPGEPPPETAARELVEETGYSAETLTPIGTYYTSPGFADEFMHAYVATELTAGVPCPEPGEEVLAEAFTMEQIDIMIAEGMFIDGKSLAALFLWRRTEDQS
jgi:ADP-ribose pyrophosphatase